MSILGGLPFVRCWQLLIQYIHIYPQYIDTCFFHMSPKNIMLQEDAVYTHKKSLLWLIIGDP